MREIKFRAWDKLGDDEGNPCMRSWDQLLRDKYANSADSIFNDKMLILMQYTGIKDKNGVEIYEGDIVRHRESDLWGWDRPRTVVWKGDEDYPAFDLDPWIDCDSNCLAYCMAEGDIEVIGNVCEHPELVDPSRRHFSTSADVS